MVKDKNKKMLEIKGIVKNFTKSFNFLNVFFFSFHILISSGVKILYLEFVYMLWFFYLFISDLLTWYINLEVKLDIVNRYYNRGQGIIIRNTVTK